MFLRQKWGTETRENEKFGQNYISFIRTVLKNAQKRGKLKHTTEQWLLKAISNSIQNRTINRLCVSRLILETNWKIKAKSVKHVKWRGPVRVTKRRVHLSLLVQNCIISHARNLGDLFFRTLDTWCHIFIYYIISPLGWWVIWNNTIIFKIKR